MGTRVSHAIQEEMNGTKRDRNDLGYPNASP